MLVQPADRTAAYNAEVKADLKWIKAILLKSALSLNEGSQIKAQNIANMATMVRIITVKVMLGAGKIIK